MTAGGENYINSMIDLAGRYANASGSLVRLTYVSRRVPSANDDTIVNVFLDASVRNFLAGVSGQVWISARHFVQTLEGTAGTVEGIYRRICSDTRHAECTCIARKRVESRSFSRPITWNRVQSEIWAVVGVPFEDDAMSFDDVCNVLILRGSIAAS